MPTAQIYVRPFRHRLAVALAVLAGTLAIALADGPSTSAQTAQLDQVRAQQDQVRAQLADQNAAVDSLLGQVSQLRQREDAVAAELADQEAKLAAARTTSPTRAMHWLTPGAGSTARWTSSSSLLVSIYRTASLTSPACCSSPTASTTSATRSAYLSRIQDYQSGVVDRVRNLREAASAHVSEVQTSIDQMQAARARSPSASRPSRPPGLARAARIRPALRAGAPARPAHRPPGQGAEPRQGAVEARSGARADPRSGGWRRLSGATGGGG